MHKKNCKGPKVQAEEDSEIEVSSPKKTGRKSKRRAKAVKKKPKQDAAKQAQQITMFELSGDAQLPFATYTTTYSNVI